jgi:catechol 2,3-dioxygenase-like lactoylglutathione lyase family enzyme
MKFAGVHLFVRDLGKALAFYRHLGLSFPGYKDGDAFAGTEAGPGVHIAFGTFQLTRGYDPRFREPQGGTPNCLQFELGTRAEVDRIHAQLSGAGYASHLPPHDAFWGSRYAEVEDPDGNLVGFQSPVDPSKRSRPPGL